MSENFVNKKSSGDYMADNYGNQTVRKKFTEQIFWQLLILEIQLWQNLVSKRSFANSQAVFPVLFNVKTEQTQANQYNQ